MNTDTSQDLGSTPDIPNVTVYDVRGAYSGPPEISSSSGDTNSSTTDTEAIYPVIESAMQWRFNSAVDMCRAINNGRGYFHGRKSKVVLALDAANELYHAVKACPELAVHLRKLDLLQNRIRKLSESKTHLLCMYCAMQPNTEDDYKDCSDYTAYLIQAEYEEKSPDDFAEWAKGQTLKGCLRAVRARKRVARTADSAKDAKICAELRLSIRRGAKGVRGTLDGDKFELSEETLSAIIDLIEAERLASSLETGNSMEGVDA